MVIMKYGRFVLLKLQEIRMQWGIMLLGRGICAVSSSIMFVEADDKHRDKRTELVLIENIQ